MLLDSPLFSIIVPIYNCASYLERCINSILNQTYGNYELLLVNDGSSDSSGSICERFAASDRRIKVFHKKNGGVSSARNLGLDHMSGEWVVFCDADDWVQPFWLSTYVENLGNLDMVCQGMNFISSDNSRELNCIEYGVDFIGSPSLLLEKLFYIRQVGYVVSKCFKSSILKTNNLKFDERFNFQEDEEFVLRYLRLCNNVISIKRTGYNYIVPDFKSKYVVRNGFLLYSSLYSSARVLFSAEDSNYANWASTKMLDFLIKEFPHCDFKTKRYFLKLYKKLLGPNLLTSRMYAITRYVIYFNPIDTFSVMLLSLHISMRNRLH